MALVVHVGMLEYLQSPRTGVGSKLLRTGVKIQNKAKRLCPVRTGRLRSSIETSAPVRRGSSMIISVGTNVKYARYVEEGTRFMEARPYLRPALEQELSK